MLGDVVPERSRIATAQQQRCVRAPVRDTSDGVRFDTTVRRDAVLGPPREVVPVRIDRGLLGWGLFLVLLGAVPLAVRAGVVTSDVAGRAWQLWPLFVVAIGLSILGRGTAVETLAGLAFPIVFGLMAGGVLATGNFPFGGCGDRDEGRPFASSTGTLGGNAEIEIDLPCGDLQVTAVSGTAWQVAGSDEDGEGPRIESGDDRLEVRADDGFGFFEHRPRWEIEVPTTPSVSLDTSINAGDGRLDLGGATLAAVSLEVNAGSGRLDLSIVNSLTGPVRVDVNAGSGVVLLPEQSLTGEMEVNAGSIVICTPPDAGIRITTNDNVTASFDFGARGLVQQGNVWETAGFDAAPVRIELQADANAGSIALDRQPECAVQAQG
jgi:hypothetical protein